MPNLSNSSLTELHSMWRTQLEHWGSELVRYGYDPTALTPEQQNDLHLRLCHHLSSEVDEVLQCADWRIHKRGRVSGKRALAFECVDVFKFLLNVMILKGITPEQFVEAFEQKSEVVTERVKWEVLRAKVRSDKPVFICDIDGVLCNRDATLLKFANDKVRVASVQEWTSTHEIKACIGREGYERVKAAFYADKGFLRSEPFKDNVLMLDACRAPILLVTSRDVKRYPHLEYETYAWLDAHNVRYDAVCFDAEKDRVTMWVAPTSVFIDDEAEHVRAMDTVCTAYRYTAPHNLAEAIRQINERHNKQ